MAKRVAIQKHCPDCDASISSKAKRCKKCFHLSTRGRIAWNKDKRTAFVVCIDCGKKSYHNGKIWKRCRKCANVVIGKKLRGRKHPNPHFVGNKNRLGKKHTEATKKKVSATKQGIPLEDWESYAKTKNQRIRESKEYQLWRVAVFMRDDYTCQTCSLRGGKLEADHIKPFSLYPELRFAIDNGRTLCRACHRQTDTWGFKLLWQKK